MSPRIQKPDFNFYDIYKSCIDNMKNGVRKKRVTSYEKLLISNRSSYIKAMRDKKIFIENLVTEKRVFLKEDMEWLYTNKFSKQGQPARKYYKSIRESAPNDRCPYCLHGDVGQVDHYLPKSIYPSLAITTENLVPTCVSCNTEKNDKDVLFPHPYFDETDQSSFLRCNIQVSDGELVFDYYIEKTTDMSETVYQKLENLFDTSRLFRLYNKHASSEFNLRSRTLVKSALRGEQDLRETLKDNYLDASEAISINSWQSVLYKDLLNKFSDINEYLLEKSK